MEIPTVDPDAIADWVIIFQTSTEILSAILGIVIAYLAYRGYRRNGSRPMLFIAIGFVLVLAIPFLLFVLFGMFPELPPAPMIVVMQTCQVAGLASILYALWMPA